MTKRSRLQVTLSRWRLLAVLVVWIGSLGAAALAGAYAFRYRANIRALVSASSIIETNLYNLSVREIVIPAEGREGGIAPLADGILFANRVGAMWYAEPDLSVREIALHVPINFDDFEADPFNASTTLRDQFAVKDLLVQELGDTVRVTAAHNQWSVESDCYMLRVSSLETSARSILSGPATAQHEWKSVFETPCVSLTENPNGINRNPTNGAGGRLAALSDHEVLLTVGGFGPGKPFDETVPFQKTILIDMRSGESRIYTSGHRNAQGLAVSATGEIWLTEHGARGGDELNLLVEGRHYGFPFVAYGTAYESMIWPSNPRQGRHEGFEKPMFSWVPSIGASQVTVIEGPLFEHWRGDVMVSSLRENSLFRVRVEDGRVIFVEPIPIGHRIRDIVQAVDGTIVLKTDDNFLTFIRPIDDEAMASAELSPRDRGRLLATNCSGCHTFEREGSDGIGPNLWGVVGNRVASHEEYAYSEALRALGGSWTPDLLRSFLSDPSGVVPGTTMAMTTTYEEAELDALLAYLETLR